MTLSTYDIAPTSVKPLASQILTLGNIINVVNKWDSDAVVDTVLLNTLENMGATLVYDMHATHPTVDVTLVLRPIGGLQWNQNDCVTLVMLPLPADWQAINDDRDVFQHAVDAYQWHEHKILLTQVTKSYNMPARLIDNTSSQDQQRDVERYFSDTVISLQPELLKHWHRICFVYAGANQEWCIDRVPFEVVKKHIQSQLSSGKDKVIFVNSDEAVLPNSVMKCHRIVRYFSDLDPDTWFYVTGSINGEETYNNFCAHIGEPPRMNIISGYRFESVAKSTLLADDEPQSSDEKFCVRRKTLRAISSDPVLKPKNFVCFNRMTRWHRVQILTYCLSHDLVKDSYYSFDLETADDGYQDKEMWNIDADNSHIDNDFLRGWLQSWKWSDAIYNNWHLFPLVLNRTTDRENPVQICAEDIEYHTNSYFSVVPETAFHKSLGQPGRPTSMDHSDGVFVSEKVYKPIAYKHPFIVASTPGYLRQLRLIGYKTFHPFIDESYDLIEDDDQRMTALCEQINILCNKSDSEMLEFLKNVQPIVEHNLEFFLDDNKNLSTTQINVEEKFK